MKKMMILFLSMSLLWVGSQSLSFQEEKKDTQKEISAEMLKTTYPPYNPEGRRDPFKDLLAGRDIGERVVVGVVSQMSINDVNLIGIVKAKGEYTAIISSTQGFPFYIKARTKFSDGYLLSIQEDKVIFRKTKQEGLPLLKPKDIVKEINPEEQ